VTTHHASAVGSWTLDSLRAGTLTWLGAHEWLGGRCTEREVDKWRFHEFAALLYPAASAEIIACAGFWSQMIAVLDDVCEEDRAAIGALRALASETPIVERGLLPTLARAWDDLGDRIAGANASYRSYLRAAFDELLDAYEWEHEWRERGGFPPLAEYERWRWRSGGVRVFATILARQAGLDVEQLARPALEQAVEAAGTLACMANDGVSASWDRAQKNPINAVCIAEAHAQSFDAWQARWNGLLSTALVAPELVASPIFREGLGHLVNGTMRWMQLTARYDLAGAPAVT
jgi:hypothetical protein